ncbi:MAG: hypothetical protein LBV30_03080 [Propionibacteriaceae bacterium]|jgi:hypothetical protein|nr:hypothetical protein [Propionibacteriaceae bacterium]
MIAAAGPCVAGVVGLIVCMVGALMDSSLLVVAGLAAGLNLLGLLPGSSDGDKVWGLAMPTSDQGADEEDDRQEGADAVPNTERLPQERSSSSVAGAVKRLLILIGCAVLTGCSGGVASDGSNDDPVLETAASEFSGCLEDMGIRTDLTVNADGVLALVEFDQSQMLIWSVPGGETGATTSFISQPGSDEALNSVISMDYEEPYLLFNGVDRSAEFAACLVASKNLIRNCLHSWFG